jgi:hypothetical protein
MLDVWLKDLEALEAISQDDLTRRLCLRMAVLSQNGKLAVFLHELADDDELDEETKGMLVEIAAEPAFLLTVADYLRETHRFH